MWTHFHWEMTCLFFRVTYKEGITLGSLMTYHPTCSDSLGSLSLLSGILLPLLLSPLTCFPFTTPAVYGDGDVVLGHFGHP